jgi:hypothetical protein
MNNAKKAPPASGALTKAAKPALLTEARQKWLAPSRGDPYEEAGPKDRS